MDSSATNQKISWFRKEDAAGTLDLSPQFQRRPVWTLEQSSFLIDTILSGLPVPEIYIRSSSSPSGETQHEVVDGQQRIRSILQFASNDIELSGSDINPKWAGWRFDDLSDQQKMAFWDYKIVVRDVTGATDIEIRDLFKRLNIHSVVLNNQELRHAHYTGHFIRAMEALADDDWWLSSRIVNVRQIRRMEDVEFVSELFVGMIAGPQDKKSSLDEYYANFDAEMPQKTEWIGRFEQTRDFIQSLLTADEVRRWSGKSDFYTLFLAMVPVAEKGITATERKALRVHLNDFRDKVDQAKRRDNRERFPQDVHDYAEALTRAATDLGRRATRLTILERRVADVLEEALQKAKKQQGKKAR